MVASGSQQQFAPRLPAGVQLGNFVLGAPLWPLRIADAYRGNGPSGPATIYVVHAQMAQHAAVRDQVVAGTRAAAALPEHKHLVRTLAAGLTGEILWIATEEVDGQLVRDMLVKKKQAGTAGFGARGTGNLITGVAGALAEITHGALSAESVVVNRSGRVRIADLALGPGTLAAIHAGLVAPSSSLAPELAAGGAPSSAGDVYAVGALLYEALVGAPLERGGPRPSDVVPGTNQQIDELVARACHRDPEKRFGRVDVLGEVVGEALGAGGAMQTVAVPTLKRAPTLEQHVQQTASLAQELAGPSLAASGNVVVDRALAAALADSTEKWLVTKGRLDHGPFSLAEVVAQIEKGDVVRGNVIMDKDTGERMDIADHPLLGPIVETARQRLDDQRRAQAEIAVQSREKKRGAVLYALIGLGVLGAALGAYFVIEHARHDDDNAKVAGISKLDGAQLKVTVTMPKAPPRKPHVHHTGGGHASQGNASEDLSLDMSDDSDDDSTETLGMDKVYAVYSKRGGQLGGCLASTGSHHASIGIIIDGPSGKVTFVKVNNQKSGALWSCINRVMRSMQFPTIHGTRTRAEFDIGL